MNHVPDGSEELFSEFMTLMGQVAAVTVEFQMRVLRKDGEGDLEENHQCNLLLLRRRELIVQLNAIAQRLARN